jgi:hypothetical protein
MKNALLIVVFFNEKYIVVSLVIEAAIDRTISLAKNKNDSTIGPNLAEQDSNMAVMAQPSTLGRSSFSFG